MASPSPATMAPEKGELRPILKLALPLAAAQVAQMLMSITDAAMMGHLGGTALAAGSLAVKVAFFMLLAVQGVLTAIQTLVAQARGAASVGIRSDHPLGAIVVGGLIVAVLGSVPIILVLIHIDGVLAWIGEPPALAQAALHYGRAFA